MFRNRKNQVNILAKQLADLCARCKNQYVYKNHQVFSLRVYKQDEDDRVLDDLYISINLKKIVVKRILILMLLICDFNLKAKYKISD